MFKVKIHRRVCVSIWKEHSRIFLQLEMPLGYYSILSYSIPPLSLDTRMSNFSSFFSSLGVSFILLFLPPDKLSLLNLRCLQLKMASSSNIDLHLPAFSVPQFHFLRQHWCNGPTWQRVHSCSVSQKLGPGHSATPAGNGMRVPWS